jgi:hypothetical protein
MRRRRSPIWAISREDLARIMERAQTLGDVLKSFGLNNKGGNHKTIKARLDYDNIDYSHIPLGRGSNRNRHRGGTAPTPLVLVLVENSDYSTNKLKKRLIELGYLQNRCAECGQGIVWNDKVLVLVLDHINGNGRDHRLENLRLLCPNCNSQTPTFCGRNIRQ